MKRIAATLFVLVLLLGVLIWSAGSLLEGFGRQRLEQEIARAVGRPSRVRELSVSLFPPALHVAGVELGTEPPQLASIGLVEARLSPLASLMQSRLVLTIRVEATSLDARQLPNEGQESGSELLGALAWAPAFNVSDIELRQIEVRFMLNDADANLAVAKGKAHAEFKPRDQRLRVAGEVAGVQVRGRDQQLAVKRFDFQGGFDADGLFLESATGDGEGIAVSLASRSGRPPSQVNASLDLRHLGIVLDGSFAGTATIDGSLDGDLRDPSLDARLTMREVVIGDQPVGDLDATVKRQQAEIRLADLQLRSKQGEVSGSLELETSNDVPVTGNLDLRSVNVDGLLGLFGQNLGFQNVVNGSASVTGSLRPMLISFHLDADSQALGKTTGVTKLDVRGQAESEALRLDVSLAQPESNRVSGNLAFVGSRMDGRISVESSDLAALSTVLPEAWRRLQLAGRLRGSVVLSGESNSPSVAATVAGRRLSVMGTALRSVDGSLAITGSQLQTEGIKIDSGIGAAELVGNIAFGNQRNAWELSLQEVGTQLLVEVARALGSDIPVSGGVVSGKLIVRGPWRQADLAANLNARRIYLIGEPLASVDARVTARLPEWAANINVTHAPGEELSVEGQGIGTDTVQLRLKSSAFDLGGFRDANRAGIAGTVSLEGQFSGRALQPEGWLQLRASNVEVAGQREGDVVVQAQGQRGEWTLSARAFAGAIECDGKLTTGKDFPYDLVVRLRDVELARPVAAGESVRLATTGDIRLGGSLKTASESSGTIRLNRFVLTRDGYEISAPQPILIDVEGGLFRTRSLTLSAPGTTLHAAGELSRSGRLDVEISGAGDLTWLESVARAVSSAQGEFRLSAHVKHAPEIGWSLGGQAELRDVALDFGVPVAVEHLNSRLVLSGSTIRIEDLHGRLGGGQANVAGLIDLTSGPNLDWAIADAAVSTEKGLELQLGGTGKVGGTWQDLTVNGKIQVINALYDKNIKLVDFLPLFAQQLKPAPRTEPPTTRVHLDLRINAPGELFIDTDIAKAELAAKLRIRGTTDKPTLSGTMEILDGVATFNKRAFTVTGGSIDFRGRSRINPVLNISAESEISTADADYTITATVTGTAEHPRVQLSADDPNLSQNDIFSLVSSGKTSAQLRREGGGVGAVDALALVPTGDVEKRFGKLVGVDRLEVEAGESDSSGSIEPRLTIGKDLTDRFRASMTTTFGVDPEQLVQLEYRLTRGISLLGSWEAKTQSQAGAFGGGVKLRHEFRRVPIAFCSALWGHSEVAVRSDEE